MSDKVISIDNSLFQLKKKKEPKQKLPTQSNIKKELLKKINEREKNKPENIINTIKEIESITAPIIENHIPIVESKLPDPPPYGCLSNGKNPTYRKWKNTIKNSIKPKDKTKLIKSYASFGKTKKNKISILINCHDDALKTDKETKILESHDLSHIRNYLINHGIIKFGSSAPEYILREMYMDACLAGDIYNKSTDVLIHNYLHN